MNALLIITLAIKIAFLTIILVGLLALIVAILSY